MRGLAVLFALLLGANALAANEVQRFSLSGSHVTFGSYQGELAVQTRDDKTVYVVRSVIYDHFTFEGLRVGEVWSGRGTLQGDDLKVRFVLKQAEVFTRVDAEKHTAAQFNFSLTVSYAADLGAHKTISSGDGREEIIGERLAATGEPIWRDLRQALVSKGDSFSVLGAVAMATVFEPLVLRYRSDEFVKRYAARPEFTSQNQYFIFDPTDFDFLRAHRDVLRVDNKVTDAVALSEARLRHDAYAYGLDEKAAQFERDILEKHLNELGLYATAVLHPNGTLRQQLPNGDGGLWSGMYAGSEAMRWKVTQDPQALANFKTAINGLLLMMDVTGDPAEFARTAMPLVTGEVPQVPWRQAKAPFQNIKYLEGGNNDMGKGLFHGLAWALLILPENDPLLARVRAHCQRLPQLRIARETLHVSNGLSAQGLAALASNKSEDRKKYLQVYGSIANNILSGLSLDEGFYYGGIADWSGINLAMVAQITDILIANSLMNRLPAGDRSSGKFSMIVTHFRGKLMRTWSTYATAHRDFLTVAAETFAAGRNPLLNMSALNAPVQWPKQELWPSERARAMWSLREVPITVAQHEYAFDYSLKPDWSVSAWPRMPWKFFEQGSNPQYFIQGAYQYPLFEGAAVESDNFWTGAFGIQANAPANIRHGRIDYLFVFWMARLAGLVDSES